MDGGEGERIPCSIQKHDDFDEKRSGDGAGVSLKLIRRRRRLIKALISHTSGFPLMIRF